MNANKMDLGLGIFPDDIAEFLRLYSDITDAYVQVGKVLSVSTLSSSAPIESRTILITQDHIDQIKQNICKMNGVEKFNWKQSFFRTGVQGTFNRVSGMTDSNNEINGFSIRFGRPSNEVADMLKDLLDKGTNLIISGSPGSGKTTLLRALLDMYSQLYQTFVIDKSGGEFIGTGITNMEALARTFVYNCLPFEQGKTMLRLLENAGAGRVIVDELVTDDEVSKAVDIATRGLAITATIHGNSLKDLINNPKFNALIGGIQHVTLKSDEARQLGVSKEARRRIADIRFDYLIQMVSRQIVLVYNLHEAVDDYLHEIDPDVEIRTPIGFFKTKQSKVDTLVKKLEALIAARATASDKPVKTVYAPRLTFEQQLDIMIQHPSIHFVNSALAADVEIISFLEFTKRMVTNQAAKRQNTVLIETGNPALLISKIAA